MSDVVRPTKPATSGPLVQRNWIITASLVVIAICIGGAALAYMRDIQKVSIKMFSIYESVSYRSFSLKFVLPVILDNIRKV